MTLTPVQEETIKQVTVLARQDFVQIKQWVFDTDYVKAILPRGRQVLVWYDSALDLYNVQVVKVHGINFQVSKKFEGLCTENLAQFLTSANDGKHMEWKKNAYQTF